MGNFKKLAQKRLFLPVFSMILVMLINVVYDIATGSAPLSFFMISIKNGVLYGRLIDILNRGSEIAVSYTHLDVYKRQAIKRPFP